MMKPYAELELEVIRFDAEDVLSTSGSEDQPVEVTHPEGYSEYSGTFNGTAGSRWMKETAYHPEEEVEIGSGDFDYYPASRDYVDEDGTIWHADDNRGWSTFYS